MGMLFNTTDTLNWINTVHKAFHKAWPVFTASQTARANWANLFRKLATQASSHDTLVRYMALKHPTPKLEARWQAWLALMDNSQWATTIGGYIADAIQDTSFVAVEFHPVPSPYIYATFQNILVDPQLGTYSKSITIHTLTWDGKGA